MGRDLHLGDGVPGCFGRQLDGMGGGISSLSKVMVVSRSDRAGVDLDYTFGQVEIAEAVVDYSGNCGNLSAGVVPFALLTGLIAAGDGCTSSACSTRTPANSSTSGSPLRTARPLSTVSSSSPGSAVQAPRSNSSTPILPAAEPARSCRREGA